MKRAITIWKEIGKNSLKSHFFRGEKLHRIKIGVFSYWRNWASMNVWSKFFSRRRMYNFFKQIFYSWRLLYFESHASNLLLNISTFHSYEMILKKSLLFWKNKSGILKRQRKFCYLFERRKFFERWKKAFLNKPIFTAILFFRKSQAILAWSRYYLLKSRHRCDKLSAINFSEILTISRIFNVFKKFISKPSSFGGFIGIDRETLLHLEQAGSNVRMLTYEPFYLLLRTAFRGWRLLLRFDHFVFNAFKKLLKNTLKDWRLLRLDILADRFKLQSNFAVWKKKYYFVCNYLETNRVSFERKLSFYCVKHFFILWNNCYVESTVRSNLSRINRIFCLKSSINTWRKCILLRSKQKRKYKLARILFVFSCLKTSVQRWCNFTVSQFRKSVAANFYRQSLIVRILNIMKRFRVCHKNKSEILSYIGKNLVPNIILYSIVKAPLVTTFLSQTDWTIPLEVPSFNREYVTIDSMILDTCTVDIHVSVYSELLIAYNNAIFCNAKVPVWFIGSELFRRTRFYFDIWVREMKLIQLKNKLCYILAHKLTRRVFFCLIPFARAIIHHAYNLRQKSFRSWKLLKIEVSQIRLLRSKVEPLILSSTMRFLKFVLDLRRLPLICWFSPNVAPPVNLLHFYGHNNSRLKRKILRRWIYVQNIRRAEEKLLSYRVLNAFKIYFQFWKIKYMKHKLTSKKTPVSPRKIIIQRRLNNKLENLAIELDRCKKLRLYFLKWFSFWKANASSEIPSHSVFVQILS